MAISVTPVLPVQPAQEVGAVAEVSPELVLKPGTTIDATVLKVLSADLVRIAIAALSIDVKTEIPLQQGQTLKLAVSQTENGIRLTNIAGGTNAAGVAPDAVTLSPDALVEAPTAPPVASAPPKPVLTPLEKAVVTIAAQTAATEQGSQSPLFANLASVANSPALPPKLLQAVQQVLAQQTGLDPNLDGADIKAAFQKSGLFLEASLATGVVPSSGAVPDLKAALLVLRQTLQTVLGGQTAEPASLPKGEAIPTLAPLAAQELEPQEILLPQARVPVADDVEEVILPRAGFSGVLKEAPSAAAALNLLQEAPDLAHAAKATSPAMPPALRAGQGEEVHTNTPAPPFRGALPSAQPVAPASISPETPIAPAAHHLLADTDAAIARHTLLQVASLPDRIDTLPQPAHNNDAGGPRWNFEIPFATPQGTAMAQFEISRDGSSEAAEAGKKVWRARFTLDVEPTGPVHALIALVGDKTSVRMWAERPATAERLRAGSAELSRALARAELKPGDIVVRDGTPPQPQAATAGHFLDRAL
jgi:Flagellar hook-length control protein FliK